MNRALSKKTGPHTPALQRFGWLLLIWACSVGALGIVAWGMRLVMNIAGMTS